MKKISTIAATLAMAALTASPALAQSSAVGGDVQVQNQNSPQTITQSANADQSNSGGGTGSGTAQDLGIEQNAANVASQSGSGGVGSGGFDNGTNGGFDNGTNGGFGNGFDDGANAVGGDVQVQNQNSPQTINQSADADQSNEGNGGGSATAQDLGIEQNAANVASQSGGDINVNGGSGNDDFGNDDFGNDDFGNEDFGNNGVGNDDYHHDNGEAGFEGEAHENGVVADSHSEIATDDGGVSSGQVASTHTTESGVETVEGQTVSAPAAASGGVLPDTGGASVLLVGGSILLVGGGLLARRVFG